MNVLIFAPHNDDEVLGLGGTMAKHIANGDRVYVCEVTSSLVEFNRERNKKEALNVHKFLGVTDTIFLDFPVVELPHVGMREFTNALAKVVADVRPEIVYIPFHGDMHADHLTVANGAMVAVRPLAAPFIKAVYAYETLSETGWHFPSENNAFNPNVYVDISDYIDSKVKAMELYDTKIMQDPHPRSSEGIKALAKFRGGTVGFSYAEAFMCVRQKM